MNRWLQTRQFTCPKCQATYTHDRAYAHQLFQCPHRVMAPKRNEETTARPLTSSGAGPCRRGAVEIVGRPSPQSPPRGCEAP
jgi:hypothetical protein